MNRRPIWVPLAALLAVASFALVASAKLQSIGGADVQFLAKGPAGLKIEGSGNGLNAKEKDGKLEMEASVKNLKTGIGLRDKHLKKYIHADKHGKAKLVVERSKLDLPEDGKTKAGSVTGQFTLNGVTKPLKVDYKIKRTGSDYHVQGKADVNIEHHEIEKPCYLGVCVDPVVKIRVKFKLRDK